SVSSCTTAPHSTGSSSTTAWTGCAGTACSSDSRRDGATSMALTAAVTMRWLRQLQFEGSGSGGERPPILVDGDSTAAPSPVQLLLLAAATCTASDVVIILHKPPVNLENPEISMRGTRRETEPRRY